MWFCGGTSRSDTRRPSRNWAGLLGIWGGRYRDGPEISIAFKFRKPRSGSRNGEVRKYFGDWPVWYKRAQGASVLSVKRVDCYSKWSHSEMCDINYYLRLSLYKFVYTKKSKISEPENVTVFTVQVITQQNFCSRSTYRTLKQILGARLAYNVMS